MGAMYEVGDVVSMKADPGKPSEDWEVMAVSGPHNGFAPDVVVRFRRVPEFVPGFYQWRPDFNSNGKGTATWCNSDPNKGASATGRYVRVEVRDAE